MAAAVSHLCHSVAERSEAHLRPAFQLGDVWVMRSLTADRALGAGPVYPQPQATVGEAPGCGGR